MSLLARSLDTLDNAQGVISISDYSGGVNTTESNELLKDNEAIIRKNWGNDNVGSIKKVTGHTKKNATLLGAKPVRGLFRVYQSNGTKHLLAICNGASFYSTDGGTTFAAVTSGTGLTETVFNSGVNYNNLFFFTNATDNLKLYTPGTTTMSTPSGVPTDPCRILLKRSDRRLLALVNSVNGSTLYFSKVDPTGAAADDWSAANDAGSIAIDGALSEPLTGGMTFGAVDIILKSYAAFRVWGYPTPQAQRMPGSPGCAAPQSVAQGDGLGFHLGHDGVWMFDGNKFIKISFPIEDIIDNINPSYIQNAFGVYREGLYWLFYTPSGATTNTKCIIYDVTFSNPYTGKNVWFEREALSMNCPVVFNGEGDDNELYAGASGSTGFVYRLDFSSAGADVTSDIEAIYQTKYFNGGKPTDPISHIVKRFSKIHITYFQPTATTNVRWYTNRGLTSGSFNLPATQTGVVLGVFILGTDSLAENVERTHTERLPDTAIGKDISLKFTNEGQGSPSIIRNCSIEFETLYSE